MTVSTVLNWNLHSQKSFIILALVLSLSRVTQTSPFCFLMTILYNGALVYVFFMSFNVAFATAWFRCLVYVCFHQMDDKKHSVTTEMKLMLETTYKRGAGVEAGCRGLRMQRRISWAISWRRLAFRSADLAETAHWASFLGFHQNYSSAWFIV